jgi:hypothetical protein
MKPCCPTMSEMVSLVGSRGVSAQLPGVNDDRSDIWFGVPVLIFRAYDSIYESDVHIVADVPVSTEVTIGISRCPWCGRRLRCTR